MDDGAGASELVPDAGDEMLVELGGAGEQVDAREHERCQQAGGAERALRSSGGQERRGDREQEERKEVEASEVRQLAGHKAGKMRLEDVIVEGQKRDRHQARRQEDQVRGLHGKTSMLTPKFVLRRSRTPPASTSMRPVVPAGPAAIEISYSNVPLPPGTSSQKVPKRWESSQ